MNARGERRRLRDEIEEIALPRFRYSIRVMPTTSSGMTRYGESSTGAEFNL
jgi:hypothetical protein